MRRAGLSIWGVEGMSGENPKHWVLAGNKLFCFRWAGAVQGMDIGIKHFRYSVSTVQEGVDGDLTLTSFVLYTKSAVVIKRLTL